MLESPLEIFFFNDTATTEIYTLSLHDALPIWPGAAHPRGIGLHHLKVGANAEAALSAHAKRVSHSILRSEEHTSELQSRQYLVCRLLLEKKKHLRPHSRPLLASPGVGLSRSPG